MASLELDTVCDDGKTIDETAHELSKDLLGVRFEVVTEHGPAGGHPVVRWTSDDRAELALVAARYTDIPVDDWRELVYLCSRIED